MNYPIRALLLLKDQKPKVLKAIQKEKQLYFTYKKELLARDITTKPELVELHKLFGLIKQRVYLYYVDLQGPCTIDPYVSLLGRCEDCNQMFFQSELAESKDPDSILVQIQDADLQCEWCGKGLCGNHAYPLTNGDMVCYDCWLEFPEEED